MTRTRLVAGGLTVVVGLLLAAAPARAEEASDRPSDEVEEEEPEPDEEDLEVRAPWDREGVETPRNLRGVYDKPFLASLWRRVFIGGYVELEYHDFADGILGVPEGFRLHRTNLFVYGDVSDRVRFAGELEFENEEPGEDPEVVVEMAFVDWVLFREFTLRAGAILPPLGRVNVNHDGPARDLTDRPLVSTFVIPTTLTEAGVGATGDIRLGRGVTTSYEAYLVNGFRLLDQDGNLAVAPTDDEQLLREGSPSPGGDVNPHPATTGRVSIRARDLLEVGGSWHIGTYDERSNNVLSILALDASLAWGPFALEGEFAWAGFERDTFARTAGVPDNYWGIYVQGSVSGMPEFLREALRPAFDDEGASVGAVLRWDLVDLDGDHGEALEPGVAVRPFGDTVIKFSYRFALRSIGVRDIPGREGFENEGFVFGVSSYF